MHVHSTETILPSDPKGRGEMSKVSEGSIESEGVQRKEEKKSEKGNEEKK